MYAKSNAARVAKAALIEEFTKSGITRNGFAGLMDTGFTEAVRLLDPAYPSKIDRLERGLSFFGKRLVVTVEDVA